MAKKLKKKLKKKSKIGISLFVVIVLLGIGGYYYLHLSKEEEPTPAEAKTQTPVEVKKLNIIDEDSNIRPYAIMVNNIVDARKNHAGLQDAYIVYELIVEGGITRYLALFKDVDTARIGSVRSSRHYFLDYAMENDAIYVHHGQSPQAAADFKTLKLDRIEVAEGKTGWRDKTLGVATEHTLFTSIEKLNTVTSLRKEMNKDLLLNYSIEEINLEELEGSKEAKNVSIRYSSSLNNIYEYDSVNKIYKRTINSTPHVDGITKKQYTVKNIITYQVPNGQIKNDEKNRQELNNIGSGSGWYITNGYAVPITWSKTSRSAQTVYKYQNGKEIDVNDGNTWIHIQPKDQTLNIS